MDQYAMSRRVLVLGSLAMVPAFRLSAASAKESPDLTMPGQVAFEVIRHGSVIGTHAVRFEVKGRRLLAHIDVNMRVGFGPITFFRYRHQGVEEWEDGVFQSLETRTDNNGEALSVSAKRIDGGVEIHTRDSAPKLAPAGALPLTHWNLACMSAPLFNPQDGMTLTETASFVGHDTVALANGSEVPATRYALKGAAPIDDWYEADRTWTALRAQVKDGSIVTYRRIV